MHSITKKTDCSMYIMKWQRKKEKKVYYKRHMTKFSNYFCCYTLLVCIGQSIPFFNIHSFLVSRDGKLKIIACRDVFTCHSTFHRSTKWVSSPFIKTFVIFYKSLIHNILDIQEEKIHGKKSKCVHEPKENAWKQIKLFPY